LSTGPVHPHHLIPHLKHGCNNLVDSQSLCPESGSKVQTTNQHGRQSGFDGVPESGKDCSTIKIRPSATASARTSTSGTAALAFPASSEVSTSCPRPLSSVTTCSAMFSLE
jgi:hypothetical protein